MDYMVKRVTLVFGVMFGFTAAWPGQVLAQTNVVGSGSEANRYLLVVETSRAMQRRADGVMKAVQDLLVSGMKGQFRPGDTLGIWTFNEEVYTGRFPLQRWSAETQKPLARNALLFLQGQKYEKRARLDKVLPALDRLITKSAFITVILVSSGEEKIQGTPFDERINDSYKQWRDEQRKAGMPLVTVLRAKKGRITDYSVNAAPFPVEMPPLPPEAASRSSRGKETRHAAANGDAAARAVPYRPREEAGGGGRGGVAARGWRFGHQRDRWCARQAGNRADVRADHKPGVGGNRGIQFRADVRPGDAASHNASCDRWSLAATNRQEYGRCVAIDGSCRGGSTGSCFRPLERVGCGICSGWGGFGGWGVAAAPQAHRTGGEPHHPLARQGEQTMNRREFLHAAGAITVAAAAAPMAPLNAAESKPVTSRHLPRWRGFNLLEKFVKRWGGNPPFREADFALLAEWGFDFARLPLSYLCWTDAEDWLKLREEGLKDIDDAVELGRKHGVHVNLNLHRAPGYCVNPPKEPLDLWKDEKALEACAFHWAHFAKRYKGISNDRLSFDLLNEPGDIPEKKPMCGWSNASWRRSAPKTRSG